MHSLAIATSDPNQAQNLPPNTNFEMSEHGKAERDYERWLQQHKQRLRLHDVIDRLHNLDLPSPRGWKVTFQVAGSVEVAQTIHIYFVTEPIKETVWPDGFHESRFNPIALDKKLSTLDEDSKRTILDGLYYATLANTRSSWLTSSNAFFPHLQEVSRLLMDKACYPDANKPNFERSAASRKRKSPIGKGFLSRLLSSSPLPLPLEPDGPLRRAGPLSSLQEHS